MAVTDLANPTRFLKFANRTIPWLGGLAVVVFAFGINQAIVAPDDKNAAPANVTTDANGNPVIGTAQVTFASDGTIQTVSNTVSGYGTVSFATPAAANGPATLVYSRF